MSDMLQLVVDQRYKPDGRDRDKLKHIGHVCYEKNWIY